MGRYIGNDKVLLIIVTWSKLLDSNPDKWVVGTRQAFDRRCRV